MIIHPVIKWEVGDKVFYLYGPKTGLDGLEKPKEYHGEIVNITDEGVCIKWIELSDAEYYSFNSFIAKNMILVSRLAKNNPNRTFNRGDYI